MRGISIVVLALESYATQKAIERATTAYNDATKAGETMPIDIGLRGIYSRRQSSLYSRTYSLPPSLPCQTVFATTGCLDQ